MAFDLGLESPEGALNDLVCGLIERRLQFPSQAIGLRGNSHGRTLSTAADAFRTVWSPALATPQ
jgi:hypothetical protein